MSTQVVSYQSDLLQDLIRSAETHSTLSSAEAEDLRRRISEATSEQDIAELWAELDQRHELLDEARWTT